MMVLRDTKIKTDMGYDIMSNICKLQEEMSHLNNINNDNSAEYD